MPGSIAEQDFHSVVSTCIGYDSAAEQHTLKHLMISLASAQGALGE
jgi:hypothetical protein